MNLKNQQINRMKYYCFFLLLIFLERSYNVFGQNNSDFKFEDGEYYLTVPFELWNNHIYVKVTINNSDTLDFVFDTGAGSSGIIIDSSIAAKIGLKATGIITATMTGGKDDFLITDSVSLTVDKLFVAKQKIAWFKLKEQEKEEGHKIDGILSYSFFKYFVFEIDYLNKTLTIADPKFYDDNKISSKISLIDLEKNKAPVISATLTSKKGKKIEANFVIDTGHDECIVLGKQFILNNRLEKDTLKIQPKSVNTGIGGETIHKAGNIKRFQIGTIEIQNPRTIFSFDNEGFYSTFDGVLLGGQFFKLYKLIINYPKKYLALVE